MICLKTHAACSTNQMQNKTICTTWSFVFARASSIEVLWVFIGSVYFNVCCDWPLSLLWFWFDKTHLKTAVMWKPPWWLKRIGWVVFLGLDGNCTSLQRRLLPGNTRRGLSFWTCTLIYLFLYLELHKLLAPASSNRSNRGKGQDFKKGKKKSTEKQW